MINKETLRSKYNNLIPSFQKEVVVKELNSIEKAFSMSPFNIDSKAPALIYSTLHRDLTIYYLCVKTALKEDRVLDYFITTGQNFTNQHFMDSNNKDFVMYDNIMHTNMLFIVLSDVDYTSDYTEALLIDLIETRRNNGKYTYIIYDIINKGTDFKRLTIKLYNFFNTKGYQIITSLHKMISGVNTNTSQVVSTTNAMSTPKKEGKTFR